jgi:hypothetical protein
MRAECGHGAEQAVLLSVDLCGAAAGPLHEIEP